MILDTHTPNKQLKNFIKEIWSLENYTGSHNELVYPTGEIQILFHYGKPFKKLNNSNLLDSQPQTAICGQSLGPGNVLSEKDSGVIGVVFYPHTAQAFIPIPIDEITNIEVDMEDIFKDWKCLDQQFQDCENNHSRINLIEDFLIKHLIIKDQTIYNIIHKSMVCLKFSKGTLRIKELAKQFYYSERNFERLFKKSVGISAKKTADIIKFNNSIELLSQNHSITDIAYISGYYDQSHFIHKFKDFTGYTPNQFRKLAC